MGPGIQRICNIFCRPLNVSACAQARHAVAPMFFSQISWHVPIFQTCEANFSKPITDTETMFPLKVAHDPRLHIAPTIIFRKKVRLLGFFSKELMKKTLFWTIFRLRSPLPQSWDRIQGPWFRKLYKRFIGYIVAENDVKIVFHIWCFWAKKRTNIFSKKIFSFVAHISQNW